MDLRQFGVRPRSFFGLIGVLTYPLLHGDLDHILANSGPAFVLTFVLLWQYGKIGGRVLFWSWIMSGLWIWVGAAGGNHIGYSGLIYAEAAFIFFSGFARRYYRLMALSGLVVFLYGSMVWYVLPIKPGISWEGHLFGAVAGAILAFYYRDRGPQRPKWSWELNPEEEEEEWEEPELIFPENRPRVRYIYRPRRPEQSADNSSKKDES